MELLSITLLIVLTVFIIVGSVLTVIRLSVLEGCANSDCTCGESCACDNCECEGK